MYYKVTIKGESRPRIIDKKSRDNLKKQIKNKEKLIDIGEDSFDMYDIQKINFIDYDLTEALSQFKSAKQREKFFYFIGNYNRDLKKVNVEIMIQEALKY